MTQRVVPAEVFGDADVKAGEAVSLVASRCEGCGRTEFPPRVKCPACGAVSQEVALSRSGTLRGFTSVSHPPPGALVEVPYHVGVAEFDGAIRVLGLLDTPPEDLSIGMPVETVAARAADDLVTYAFRVV